MLKAEAKYILIHIAVMLGSLILYDVSSLIDKIAPLLLLPFFMIVFPVYSVFYGVFSTRTSNIKSLLLTQAIFFCINFISILSGMLIFKTATEGAAFTLSLLADYTIFSCVGSLVMQLFCFIPAIIRRAKIKRNEIQASQKV